MPQTNRIPGGLLDLLGAETGGKTPPLYSDTLSVSVDFREFYLAQTYTGNVNSLSHNAIGDAITIEVPEDEFWLLRSLSVQAFPPLTTDFERWRWQILRKPRDGAAGNASVVWVTRLLQTQANAQFATDAILLPDPIMVSPGTQILPVIDERDASAARSTTFKISFNLLRQ